MTGVTGATRAGCVVGEKLGERVDRRPEAVIGGRGEADGQRPQRRRAVVPARRDRPEPHAAGGGVGDDLAFARRSGRQLDHDEQTGVGEPDPHLRNALAQDGGDVTPAPAEADALAAEVAVEGPVGEHPAEGELLDGRGGRVGQPLGGEQAIPQR